MVLFIDDRKDVVCRVGDHCSSQDVENCCFFCQHVALPSHQSGSQEGFCPNPFEVHPFGASTTHGCGRH